MTCSNEIDDVLLKIKQSNPVDKVDLSSQDLSQYDFSNAVFHRLVSLIVY